MGRYAASDAITLSTQALDAAERGGDRDVRAGALIVRARAKETVGASDAALADVTEGLADARAVGDRRLEMLTLRYLGGDFAAARGLPVATSYIETGLRIAMSLGDRASEADLLARLAIMAGFRLRLDAALDYGRRATAAGRASADERALATGLDGLKIACLNVGDARGLAAVLDELKPLLRYGVHGETVTIPSTRSGCRAAAMSGRPGHAEHSAASKRGATNRTPMASHLSAMQAATMTP